MNKLEEEITAEEYFANYDVFNSDNLRKSVLETAEEYAILKSKHWVKQALEEQAEKAKVDDFTNYPHSTIDKESITSFDYSKIK